MEGYQITVYTDHHCHFLYPSSLAACSNEVPGALWARQNSTYFLSLNLKHSLKLMTVNLTYILTSLCVLSISSHDLVFDAVSDVLLFLLESGTALELREGLDGVQEVAVTLFEGNS